MVQGGVPVREMKQQAKNETDNKKSIKPGTPEARMSVIARMSECAKTKTEVRLPYSHRGPFAKRERPP